MARFDLRAFAEELNAEARSHPIGSLQQIRAKLHRRRQAGQKIFQPSTIEEEWAFHYGGRRELQFNIGFDGTNRTMLRSGVAFSFETSRSMPTTDDLVARVPLFNDFIRLYPDHYADMRMWHFRRDVRSEESPPGPIPYELASQKKMFIFLGNRRPVEAADHDSVLSDMDRLLPLYEYVESGGEREPLLNPAQGEFVFRPGYESRPGATKASHAQGDIDVDLRHNILQQALYRHLASKYGSNNVRMEQPTGIGTNVDLAIRRPDSYWFYEIKTFQSPRACIREALGQLLEYAFWPGPLREVSRLVIVGESRGTADVAEYCAYLKKAFSLPVEYEQFVL
jgi:hypothetical protein